MSRADAFQPPSRPGEVLMDAPGEWQGPVVVGYLPGGDPQDDDTYRVYQWRPDGARWALVKISRHRSAKRTRAEYRRNVGLRLPDGRGKTCPLARLMCQAARGLPFDGAQADHIDHDTLHDFPDNLRWLTRKENLLHSTELGLSGSRRKLVPTTVRWARRWYYLHSIPVTAIQQEIVAVYRETARKWIDSADPRERAWAERNLEFTISRTPIDLMVQGEDYQEVPMPWDEPT